MSTIISKCGNFCSRCPWSVHMRKRLNSDESYREGIKKYVGIAIRDGKPCMGCQTPDSELVSNAGIHNFLKRCHTRQCANQNECRTCANCSSYPCDRFDYIDPAFTVSAVEKRIRKKVSEIAYRDYFEPFRGRIHLDKIRSKLHGNEIVKMKPVEPSKLKVVPFPDSFQGEDEDLYRDLYRVLVDLAESSLKFRIVESYAVAKTLEKLRGSAVKLLWLIGLHGDLDGDVIIIDSLAYMSNKKSSVPSRESDLNLMVALLKSHGFILSVEALTENWLMPSGYLRKNLERQREKPAWRLKMKREDNDHLIQTLKNYTVKLDERYGSRAYSRFKNVDMRFR